MENTEIKKQKLAFIKVESSNLDGFVYDESKETFEVYFKNGTRYKYFGVDKEACAQFSKAESAGKHFNQFIKNVYKYEKVDPQASVTPTNPTGQPQE